MQDKPITLSNLNAAAKSGASGSLLAGASGASEQSAYMKFIEAKAGFIPELGIPANFFGMPIFIWDKDEAPIESWKYVMTTKDLDFDESSGLYIDPASETIYKKVKDDFFNASRIVDGVQYLECVVYLARDYTDMCPYAKKGSFWIFKEVNDWGSDSSFMMRRLLSPKEAQDMLKHLSVKYTYYNDGNNSGMQAKANSNLENLENLSQAIFYIVTSKDEILDENSEYIYYLTCKKEDIALVKGGRPMQGSCIKFDGRGWREVSVLGF